MDLIIFGAEHYKAASALVKFQMCIGVFDHIYVIKLSAFDRYTRSILELP